MDMARTATTKQVAAALGVKETTVQLYSRQNRVPFDRTPGGHRRYDVDEVLAALGRDGAPQSRLTPIAPTGLGAGVVTTRSALADMDARRRAVSGEVLEGAETDTAAASAAVSLIEHSRRILVAV